MVASPEKAKMAQDSVAHLNYRELQALAGKLGERKTGCVLSAASLRRAEATLVS